MPIDLDALRAKYRAERERRVRPDGTAQYERVETASPELAADPHAEPDERQPVHDRVDVAVVGGGFGGLLAGARLRQGGIGTIRIVEKGADVGGTWYWNRYPGLACDIESYSYLPLLEEVGYVPQWRYAPGEEIRHHAQAVARQFDLYRDALLQTEVTDLRWDDDAGVWQVGTDRGDAFEARYVLVASGPMSQPKLPSIPGLDTFEGHLFHTSRWDYDYTGGDQTGGLEGLADKRVAIIGTGSTAIQVVPMVAADAEHLFVVQRTPSTVDRRDNRPTDPAWAATLQPGWHEHRVDHFIDVLSGVPVDENLIDDPWTSTAFLQQKLVPTDVYAGVRSEQWELELELADHEKMNQLRARIDAEVDDPEVAARLKPWYRYMCKRPTFSDTYLPTFNRPNVTLVDTADTHGVEQITATGLVVGDVEHRVDCIIFATGFDVGGSGILSGRLPVHGRGGLGLRESWPDGPRTLHGFTAPGFPNLFMIGPLQNAVSIHFVHILDQQTRHVAAVIAAAEQQGARCVEPSPEAAEAWAATIRASAVDLEPFQAECTPGYFNNEGRPRPGGQLFGGGPVAFSALLAQWRAERMHEVLVGVEESSPVEGGQTPAARSQRR